MKLNKSIHIRINKRISHRTILISVVVLIVLILATAGFIRSSINKKSESEQTMIASKTAAYATDLKDSISTLTSDDAIVDYLSGWAKTKGVPYTVDLHNNVIMHVKASSGYSDADPTVLVATYDSSRFINDVNPIALSLFIAKNSENTGDLTVIFSPVTNNSPDSLKNLNSRYFRKKTNVICLNGGNSSFCSLNSAASTTYSFTKSISERKPKGNKAVKIRISGLPGGVPGQSGYPNPIKQLGDILASFKTNANIYELAGFRGGTAGDTLPDKASATIVINKNDYIKFSERLNKFKSKFEEKYLEKYPDAEFTYEEVKLPKKVMKQSSSDTFVSALYTLLDGTFYKDNGDNLISVVNIGAVDIDSDKWVISASGNSLDASGMTEIDTTYEIICGLSGISYKKESVINSWSADKDSPLMTDFQSSYIDYNGKKPNIADMISISAASFIYDINSECNILNITLNETELSQYAGAILTYLRSQKTE